MLLSSEDSIRTELGILLSSGPSTCLNSNKLFLFSIIMMRKTAGTGKCAFEMILFFCGCRLHVTFDLWCNPILKISDKCSNTDFDQGSADYHQYLLFSIGLLVSFCGGCADMIRIAQQACVKMCIFIKN